MKFTTLTKEGKFYWAFQKEWKRNWFMTGPQKRKVVSDWIVSKQMHCSCKFATSNVRQLAKSDSCQLSPVGLSVVYVRGISGTPTILNNNINILYICFNVWHFVSWVLFSINYKQNYSQGFIKTFLVCTKTPNTFPLKRGSHCVD